MYRAVVPLPGAQDFTGPVGYHLIHVHICACSRAALNSIYNKFLPEGAVHHFPAGLYDRFRNLRVQPAGRKIGNRRRFFNQRQIFQKNRVHRVPGNLKIFLCPQGLNAVIGIFRYCFCSDRICFQTCSHDAILLFS